MSDRHHHRDRAAKAVAEEVGFLDLEVFQESSDVVGVLFTRHRTIDVGRASVALEVHGNPLPVPRQPGNQPAMAHDGVNVNRRLTFAGDLVIHLETVHRRVAGLFFRRLCRLCR